MIKYVAIALMNVLVMASIAASALLALFRGCNIDGTCSGQSNGLTWGLGVGVSMAVVVALLVIRRAAARYRLGHAGEKITIATIASPIAKRDDGPTDLPGDETMLARLARMTRSDDPDCRATEPYAPAYHPVNPPAAARQPAVVPSADRAERIAFARTGLNDIGYAATVAPVDQMSGPDLHIVVSDGERTASRPSFATSPSPKTVSPESRIAWLLEDRARSNSARIRSDQGFPWVVAGIDAVCDGVLRFAPSLVDTDIASEALAWRQVVSTLSRGDALTRQDATAFTDWFNASLRLIGRGGVAIIEDALESIETEAIDDPMMASNLPAALSLFTGQQNARLMRAC